METNHKNLADTLHDNQNGDTQMKRIEKLGQNKNKAFKDVNRRRVAILTRMLKGEKAPVLNQIEYRLVKSTEELRQSASLVYREYLKKNYSYENSQNLKFIFQQTTTLAHTFVAVLKGRILATCTLVQDSKLGLPLEKSYKDEIHLFRKKGRTLAEITMFAVDNELLNQPGCPLSNTDRVLLLMKLFKSMMNFNRARNIADIFIAAFALKHDKFYEMLQFNKLADIKLHQVGPIKNPSSARYLDIPYQAIHGPVPLVRYFGLNVPPPKIEYTQPQMTIDDYGAILQILSKPYETNPLPNDS